MEIPDIDTTKVQPKQAQQSSQAGSTTFPSKFDIEESVIAVSMLISLVGISCCVQMVGHQSSTSTTWGSNPSITQHFSR